MSPPPHINGAYYPVRIKELCGMKRLILSLTFIFFTLATCVAQRIETQKTFGGTKYTQQGQALNMNDLVNLMEPDTEAYTLMRSAKSNYAVAQVLSIPGGLLIGWPIGTAIGGGDPNWTLAAVGGGLVVATIPFSSAGNKKAKAAIDMYNQKYTIGPRKERPIFALSSTRDGYGLTVSF